MPFRCNSLRRSAPAGPKGQKVPTGAFSPLGWTNIPLHHRIQFPKLNIGNTKIQIQLHIQILLCIIATSFQNSTLEIQNTNTNTYTNTFQTRSGRRRLTPSIAIRWVQNCGLVASNSRDIGPNPPSRSKLNNWMSDLGCPPQWVAISWNGEVQLPVSPE